MKGIILVLILVLCVAQTACALMVRLSLNGVNPAPDTMNVTPGQLIGMYIISDSAGMGYWEEFYDPGVGNLSNLQIYPAAGNLASILTIDPGHFKVTADDSANNIQAGKHFSFDLTIDTGAQ